MSLKGKRESLRIIFISSTCARVDYNLICERRKKQALDSSQKFFEMFLDGMIGRKDVTVDCITVPPISHATYPALYIKSKSNNVKGITYHYAPILNLPVIKTIFATFFVKRTLKKQIKKYLNEKVIIICDPLLLEGLVPTVKLSKKHNITSVGFLTDMPNFASENENMGLIKRIFYKFYNNKTNKFLKKLDKYIVLAPAMSCVAQNKPWLLLDCIIEENMVAEIKPIRYNDGLPHVLYAGKLHKEFGLDILCEAIPLVKTKCVFDIYGDGNYLRKIKELAKTINNLNVFGIVPLKEVLRAEISCKVLVNPRMSKGEYTKYSFPSKTSEYMLSGVPLVMFRLPGISHEYEDYIMFAEEETPLALAKKIDEILSFSEDKWREIGIRAKKFIIENKNNKIQAQRIIDFISK